MTPVARVPRTLKQKGTGFYLGFNRQPGNGSAGLSLHTWAGLDAYTLAEERDRELDRGQE